MGRERGREEAQGRDRGKRIIGGEEEEEKLDKK